MSTLFIIDGHTNPIANSDINEVRYNTTQAPLTGNFIVRVPNDMALAENPSNLSGLLAAKYAACLTFFSTFANIVFEDFTDTPGIDNPNSPGTFEGIRCTTRVGPRIGGSGGILRTDTAVLGGPPSIVAVTWEVFQVATTNPPTGRLTQQFSEAPSSNFTAEISFNNGGSWTAVTDRSITNIAGGDQGTNMVLRFTNSSAVNAQWLGSWAVLF